MRTTSSVLMKEESGRMLCSYWCNFLRIKRIWVIIHIRERALLSSERLTITVHLLLWNMWLVANLGFLCLLCQIDLVDMRSNQDGAYKWIGHFMDHWSKFSILFPLERKTGALVAEELETKVFSIFGTPKILHHDNGREFVNDIVRHVVQSWPGETVIITGRARHPQSQGMIEQANGTLKRLLGSRMSDWQSQQRSKWYFSDH